LREEFYGDSVDFDEAEYGRNLGSLQNSWRCRMHVKKQVSVFLLHSGYILQKLRERERERESHPHAVYQRKLCGKFYILLGN
jgi:hypothetical protein